MHTYIELGEYTLIDIKNLRTEPEAQNNQAVESTVDNQTGDVLEIINTKNVVVEE